MAESKTTPLRLLFLGKKSYERRKTANIILATKAFKPKETNYQMEKSRNFIQKGDATYDITVYDAPGMDGIPHHELQAGLDGIKETLSKDMGCHAIIIVAEHPVRWTSEEEEFYKMINRTYGRSELEKFGFIVFADFDDEEECFSDYLAREVQSADGFGKIIAQIGVEKCLINDGHNTENGTFPGQLLTKIKGLKGEVYVGMPQPGLAPMMAEAQMTAKQLRLLFVSMTSYEKRATANFLFGKRVFNPRKPERDIQYHQDGITVDGVRYQLAISDVPGLDDPGPFDEMEAKLESHCASLTKQTGYHAIVIIVRHPVRWSPGDEKFFKTLHKIFGAKHAKKFAFIVFCDTADLDDEGGFPAYLNEEKKTKGFGKIISQIGLDKCINNDKHKGENTRFVRELITKVNDLRGDIYTHGDIKGSHHNRDHVMDMCCLL